MHGVHINQEREKVDGHNTVTHSDDHNHAETSGSVSHNSAINQRSLFILF